MEIATHGSDGANPVGMAARGERLVRRILTCVMGAVLIIDIGVVHGVMRAAAFRIAILPVNSERAVETMFFRGSPTLWMQAHIPESVGTIPAVELWWSLFYVPTLLSLVVLVMFGRAHFFRLALLYAAMLFSADLYFALAPMRPPWLDDAAVNRMLAEHAAPLVLADNNPLAAVPSLHVGVPALWAMWFCHHHDIRMRRIGMVLTVWTLGMLWAVVYTGEHYVMGAVAGMSWAIVVYAVVDRVGLAQVREKTPAAGEEQPAAIAAVAEEPAPLLPLAVPDARAA